MYFLREVSVKKMIRKIMRNHILRHALVAFLLLLPFGAQATLTITPQNQDELLRFLKALSEDHPDKKWCDEDCAQIHSFKLSGTIASGKLKLEITGAVVGRRLGVVPLLSSVPAMEITSLKNENSEAPLFFTSKAYHTFLPPGPFNLVGEIKLPGKSAINVTLPGAVGKIELDIADQEPMLTKVSRGQYGGGFQIVSAVKAGNTPAKAEDTLRLMITRRFTIARDKSFLYVVNVVGAKPGQIISVPLEFKEKVLQINPQGGKISADKVDFTAPDSVATFEVEGEWTLDTVELTGPSGAVQETWEVSCEGAFDCGFEGDVESSTADVTHKFSPMPGQKLKTSWKELGTLSGQSKVAQKVELTSEKMGKGIKQTLKLSVTSSAVDQMVVKLPSGAVPTSLMYGASPSDVLTTRPGEVHLSIAQGNQDITLVWEMTEWKSVKLPVPGIDLPSGVWVFKYSPSPGTAVVQAGGVAGSPVVLFWPRLGFCLLAAIFYFIAEKKLIGAGQSSLIFLIVFSAGFALAEPVVILVPLAFFAATRWLERVSYQRTVPGRLFEGGILILLTFFVIAAFIEVLDRAFFSSRPFAIQSFCSSESYIASDTACWRVALADPEKNLPIPYVISFPIFGMRVIYFAWALASGFILYREFLRFGRGVVRYWKMGARPLVAKSVKSE